MTTSNQNANQSGFVTEFGDMRDLSAVRKLLSALLYSSAKDRGLQGLPTSRDEAIKLAGEAVYFNLTSRGTVFNCEGVGYILLRGHEDQPIRVSPTNARFVDLIVTTYGIATGSEAERRIGKFLGVRVVEDGTRTHVRQSFSYDKETRTAYFAERIGQLIRITKNDVDRVPNGTDGQLFEFTENYSEVEIDLNLARSLPEYVNSTLVPSNGLALMFDGVEFGFGRLSIAQKGILITTWILLVMLPGLIVEKPILQIVGPSGSGKTSLLEAIGRTLFGPNFRVERLTDDVKEFENSVINNDLLAIDNATSIGKQIRSLICQTVTGFRVTRRELFTTMGQVQRSSTATLAVAGITKMLNEAETSNRSIDVNVLERAPNENVSEQDLHDSLDSNRARILGELAYRIQGVLQALYNQRDFVPKVSLRLAGFAGLILRVAKHEGWMREAEILLDRWNQEQNEAALEGEDLADMIRIWMSAPEWRGDTFSAQDLNRALNQVALKYSISETSWKNRPQYLGIQLQRSMSSYRKKFGLEIFRDKHTKANLYRFAPTEEQLSFLRTQKSSAPDEELESHGQEVMFQ